MKKAFWKSDWFVGLAISVVFLGAWWLGNALLEGLERDAYDLGVRMSHRDPDDNAKIAVIAIDDQSIQNIGRWPWSREVHAKMVDKLLQAGAKTVGLTVFYSEAQVDPGLKWIEQLRGQLAKVTFDESAADNIGKTLTDAERELDTDRILAESLQQAGNVVLAMQFVPGEPIGNPDEPLPDSILRFAIQEDNIQDPSGEQANLPMSTVAAVPPIARLNEAAASIGHLVNPLDVDGGIRFEPLVVGYYDRFFPSQSLMIAASSLNLGVDAIKINLGENVQLGRLKIATDELLQMNTYFYGDREGDRPAFDVFSFYDVYQDNIPLDNFKGKIVLIGATAFGVGSNLHTPIGDVDGPVLIMAHTVASILNEDFFVRPAWAAIGELLAFLLVAAYLVAALPRLKAGPAALISAALFTALVGAELGLMASQAMWLKLITAAALLAVGHVLLTTKRFLVTEASKLRLDVDSAASNKQLALQYQQEGKLDMAFDFFRKCPIDEALLENIYNLALDYERKRQFNKAHSAYQFIEAKDPNFRDIKAKVNRAKNLEETVLLGGASAGSAGSTLLLDGSVSKPVLGRYEIEKELGKGAMGIVYLGKDPKINRVVAIKTMALSAEFEADELADVKARFFREAETAGRLTHPNIVTVYDAGEALELAYIAMEFLEGHDLVRYTKEGALLPIATTMGIVFKAAMALDFAHKQNVVHRDIKPANIMYEPSKKQVKLTDFGIARITDSSKTKTGMVLGTPSYMSPEQLSGKKVDGRSDLFSLGVTLYQLVTGNLPFKGESMATLMYKIANEPHQDVFEFRPELKAQKPCLAAIINKALQKDADRRYQTGGEMARDIQQCAKQVVAK